MNDRAEAFILQSKSGQWMVEVWSAGEPVQCVAGLETEMDAIEEASNLAGDYDELEFVTTQGRTGRSYEAHHVVTNKRSHTWWKLSTKSCESWELSTHKRWRMEGLSTHKRWRFYA